MKRRMVTVYDLNDDESTETLILDHLMDAIRIRTIQSKRQRKELSLDNPKAYKVEVIVREGK